MHRLRIAVLGVLNQENHEEGNDGGAGVDDELPRVRITKGVSGCGPNHDDCDGDDERPGAAEDVRGFSRENAKGITDPAKKIALVPGALSSILSAVFAAAVGF